MKYFFLWLQSWIDDPPEVILICNTHTWIYISPFSSTYFPFLSPAVSIYHGLFIILFQSCVDLCLCVCVCVCVCVYVFKGHMLLCISLNNFLLQSANSPLRCSEPSVLSNKRSKSINIKIYLIDLLTLQLEYICSNQITYSFKLPLFYPLPFMFSPSACVVVRLSFTVVRCLVPSISHTPLIQDCVPSYHLHWTEQLGTILSSLWLLLFEGSIPVGWKRTEVIEKDP